MTARRLIELLQMLTAEQQGFRIQWGDNLMIPCEVEHVEVRTNKEILIIDQFDPGINRIVLS